MILEIDKHYRFVHVKPDSRQWAELESEGIYRGVEVNIEMNLLAGGRHPMETFITFRTWGGTGISKFPLKDLLSVEEIV